MDRERIGIVEEVRHGDEDVLDVDKTSLGKANVELGDRETSSA